MKVSVWLPSNYCFVFIFQWHHRRTDRDRCNNPQRPLSIPLQKLRKQSQTVKMLPLPLWGWLHSCAINTILGKGHLGKWRSNSIGITRKYIRSVKSKIWIPNLEFYWPVIDSTNYNFQVYRWILGVFCSFLCWFHIKTNKLLDLI